MEQETLVALIEDVVDELLVELGAEGHGCESLSLAAGEDGASVRAGQIVDLTPDGADLVGLAAVKTDALVEDAAAHGLFLNVVVVAFDHRLFLFALFFGQRVDIFLADGVERVLTPVFVGVALLGDGIGLVVAFVVDILAQSLVVDFVAVFALDGRADLFGELHLGLALNLDGVVGNAESFEQSCLAHFVHLAFDHHYVVVGGADHKLEVSSFGLFEGRVDDEFAVFEHDTNLRDRGFEGNIADGEGCRGGEAGQGVGHIFAVGRVEGNLHDRVGVIIRGEQGAQNAVDQT